MSCSVVSPDRGAPVGEVTLDSARSKTHELGGHGDGSASFDEGGENIHLALRRLW
jgi:hypothetical protein